MESGKISQVPGNGDCAALAIVKCLIALIATGFLPKEIEQMVVAQLKKLCFDKAKGVLVPSMLRTAITDEPTEHTKNARCIGTNLTEDGFSVFICFVSSMFRVNVYQKCGARWVDHQKYQGTIYMSHPPDHFDAFVPNDWLPAIKTRLSDKYDQWCRLFFKKSSEYTVKGKSYVFEGQKFQDLTFDMDMFQHDITQALNIIPNIEPKPEWERYFLNKLLNKPLASGDQDRVQDLVNEYLDLSDDCQLDRDKEEFERDDAEAARRLANQ